MPELGRWQSKHADAPLSLWYFGSDSAADEKPFRRIDLLKAENAAEVRSMVAGTFVAASTTFLFTYYPDHPATQFLLAEKPFASTSTYLIFDFREVPAVESLSDKSRLSSASP